MKTQTYQLTVDAAQLEIIRRACETLARMGAWQFRVAFQSLEFINEKGKSDCLTVFQCAEIEKAIAAIAPEPKSLEKNESELLAWGIHKAIKHQWHVETGSTEWSRDSSPPINPSEKSKLMKIVSCAAVISHKEN